MLFSCLAIVLGLLLIYLFIKKRGSEGLTKREINGKKAKVSSRREEQSENNITFEGTDVYILNVPSTTMMHTDISGEASLKPTQLDSYSSDLESSYSNTINHYPQESIRFDLLTPIPYSDAFASPMGPKLPKPNSPETATSPSTS